MLRGEILRDGMTLVEILVSLGIVACLSALALPMFGRISALRDNTICSSNLKQIGAGICSYTSDHNGVLPGPLLSGQQPYFDSLPTWHRSSQLGFHLRDYLNIGSRSPGQMRNNVLICPARKQKNKNYENMVHYGVNIQVRFAESLTSQQPFGYANSMDWTKFGRYDDVQPMKISDLSRIVDEDGRSAASTTFAVMDADALDGRFAGLRGAPGVSNGAQPSHASRRNALFFDFHIEPLLITKTP